MDLNEGSETEMAHELFYETLHFASRVAGYHSTEADQVVREVRAAVGTEASAAVIKRLPELLEPIRFDGYRIHERDAAKIVDQMHDLSAVYDFTSFDTPIKGQDWWFDAVFLGIRLAGHPKNAADRVLKKLRSDPEFNLTVALDIDMHYKRIIAAMESPMEYIRWMEMER